MVDASLTANDQRCDSSIRGRYGVLRVHHEGTIGACERSTRRHGVTRLRRYGTSIRAPRCLELHDQLGRADPAQERRMGVKMCVVGLVLPGRRSGLS
jgi:hypothetical protein